MKYFDPYYLSDELFSIVFLCGCKFNHDDDDDKRIVLKNYLENNHSLNVIILEEHFNFESKKRRPDVLYYDDIFLSDLSQIETMAALFANKIYIIHESISTAAELGLFAGNTLLFPKIELIVPNIPDKLVTTFIDWAFFRNPEHTLGEQIKFFPNIEEAGKDCEYQNKYIKCIGKKKVPYVETINYSKKYYKTYFREDEFVSNSNKNLSANIDNSVKSIKKSVYKGFNKIKFNASKDDSSNIEYEIIQNVVNIYIGTDALKIQLLSLLYDDDLRKELCSKKTICDHVSYIENYYKELTQSTIATLECIDNKGLRFKYYIKGFETVKLRAAIGLFLYFMQALGLIEINSQSIDSRNIATKLLLKVGLDKFKFIKELISDKSTIFERSDIL